MRKTRKDSTVSTATATVENEASKRGRKPGTKVQSLDWRAAKSLRSVDFDLFFNRKIEGDTEWKDDLIEAIVYHMREKDIF